jgi:hypothetical protein
MNRQPDVELVLRDYFADDGFGAPDHILDVVEQRISRQPRRFAWRLRGRPFVNTYTKLAAGVAAVLIIGFAGWRLLPRDGSVGGEPTPLPTITSAPAVTSSPRPTQAPYVPGALSETFTSGMHGLSISYPAGWTARAATQPWTTSVPQFGDAAGDNLYDPQKADHLFLDLASQPLAGRSFSQWSSDLLAFMEADDPDCTGSEPIVIDGADGLISPVCTFALVSSGGRGYLFMMYTSGDDADLRAFDSRSWFIDVLATVQLPPQDAVDTAPSTAP